MAALVGAVALTGGLVVGQAHASPGSGSGTAPAPTVASITVKLDRLAQQTETLAEQYNAVQVTIGQQERALATASRKRAAAQAEYDVARREFAAIAAARYEGGAFSTAGAMLSSPNSSVYLDTLDTQELLSDHSADLLAQIRTAGSRAEQAGVTAGNLIAAARAQRVALSQKRQQVVVDTAKYRTLVSGLTAAQRQAYSDRGAPTEAQIAAALQTPASSPAAQRAVDFAVAQVGKPYVWAAAGPDAFDCSGLTMAAWAQGGVALPHFSAAQYTYGRHVGYDQLEPGDLVFLYSDIHHVEIYVGAGLAISAPQEGEPVRFVRVADYRADFAGATRLP
jgi:cell wall-associated NlpC family hydrolase